MEVSGNMATVTTKYSQPTGRPYGFVVDPEFKDKRLVPVSEVSISKRSLSWSARTDVEGVDLTVCRSICTTSPTI